MKPFEMSGTLLDLLQFVNAADGDFCFLGDDNAKIVFYVYARRIRRLR